MRDLATIARMPIPGGWTRQVVKVGEREIPLILPADADRFLDELEVADSPALADPFWARLWPAATSLAGWLLRRTWAAEPALELGCGVGLVGIAACLAGLRVTFSDRIAVAVDVAVANARELGCEEAAGLVFDWASPPSVQYPVVLASDVLYDRSQYGALAATLDRVVAPGGVVYLGDPGRHSVGEFVEQCRRRGYTTTLYGEDGQVLSHLAAGQFQVLELRDNHALVV
ncbi:MAG: methyltransferase [Pirellulaceae bacterium]